MDRPAARSVVEALLTNPRFAGNVTHIEHVPAQTARFAEWPAWLDNRLRAAIERRGVTKPYRHQRAALDAVHAGRNVVIVTPTASGKTLCYNAPTLDAALKSGEARALYLFPTKALAADQAAELHELVEQLGVDIKTYTYDGDTPVSARRAIRSAGHVVVTNPDMLHAGILPHHTRWLKLFSNLQYVIIDELHTYRGVFGSHLANVLRRLRRVCRHYGANPTFICCSATIANPGELAERLIEAPVDVIGESGAPRGAKSIVFYNPPVVNRQLGIRRGGVLEARRLVGDLLIANDIQTIVFGRSRVTVEVLLTYVREEARRHKRRPDSVRGYRGGYLPLERRAIEAGLRDGSIRTVVSTNALELGIDIGGLEASVTVGYPGTIASAWQQMGRAGRRVGDALSLFIATSDPLDQFVVQNPAYFFDQSPESGLLNPDNLLILIDHLKCAAFELPFHDNERFGSGPILEALEFLASEGAVHRGDQVWHWLSDVFPAESVGLRMTSRENVVIVDVTEPKRSVIGEIDRFAAPMLVHDEAIYLHEGRQYQVQRLDWANGVAEVKQVSVDYYTDASLATDLRPIDEFDTVAATDGQTPTATLKAHGEVTVRFLPTMFKKIKFDTHENVGSGPIHLPEQILHTTAYWLIVPAGIAAHFSKYELDSALHGLGNVLARVAPIYLMCDARDIRLSVQSRSPHTDAPTVFLYEAYPAGVGFSEKLFHVHAELLARARDLISRCPCRSGCPSCVGPISTAAIDAKRVAHDLACRLGSFDAE